MGEEDTVYGVVCFPLLLFTEKMYKYPSVVGKSIEQYEKMRKNQKNSRLFSADVL